MTIYQQELLRKLPRFGCTGQSEVKITDTSDKWYEDISGELFEENQYLVLSTCYGDGNGRLLVIA